MQKFEKIQAVSGLEVLKIVNFLQPIQQMMPTWNPSGGGGGGGGGGRGKAKGKRGRKAKDESEDSEDDEEEDMEEEVSGEGVLDHPVCYEVKVVLDHPVCDTFRTTLYVMK